MSIRIIAGEKRGAILKTPAGAVTRPTLGRVRESLFMMLQADWPGARVLDLFAGSGALGLEALSRGAQFAALVEQEPAALDALRVNIQKLGWNARTRIHALDVFKYLAAGSVSAAPFDIILADAPYERALALQTLELLGADAKRWLAVDGTVVIQAGSREALPPSSGRLEQFRTRRYGATQIAFYRLRD